MSGPGPDPASAPRGVLLTGDRGAGKSTICERLAGEARARGVAVGGVVCPAVFGPDGVKTGCRVRDLATGEEWELGSTLRDLGGPRWKGWSFSEEGFEAANRAVRAALEGGAGLVILDEIGPVELRLGAGLEPALRDLEERIPGGSRCGPETGPLVVLVVRPELLAEVSARYPWASLVTVDPADREEARERARTRLFATSPGPSRMP